MNFIDYKGINFANELSASLHINGFALLKNHPLNPSKIQNMYNHWRHFFESDIQEKNMYSLDKKKYDGFVSTEQSETAKGFDKKDEKEFFHFFIWGKCPDKLRNITSDIFYDFYKFSLILVNHLETKCHKEIRSIMDANESLLRPIYYPSSNSFIRAQEHGDINILTLLPATVEGGLQIKINNTWISAPIDPSILIINSGDMLSEITDNYYPSGIHRVLGSDKKRISLPFFSHPQNDAVLSSRYTASSYKKERFKDLGLIK
tara:strand:- start:484 stop:1266 length:783 start_codon:yes stop_codon:yes gene_type:complete